MSKNYAAIIQFVLPLRTFYRPRAQRSDVYKRDAFVTSWRFHNRAWQPRCHDSLPETSGTLWIHRGALTNQRCSLATGCEIKIKTTLCVWKSHAHTAFKPETRMLVSPKGQWLTKILIITGLSQLSCHVSRGWHNIPNCMKEVTWLMLCLSTNGHRSAGLGWLPFI